MPNERPGFAVVREDPNVEAAVIERVGARTALVVASGGCTLLTLAHRFPELQLVGFDANPAQLDHVRQKCAHREDLAALNVGTGDPAGLSQCGRFEGLFRLLRSFLQEFVWRPKESRVLLDPSTPAAERSMIVRRWQACPYWPVAFDLAFEHGFLDTLFTPAATQHADPGSYPRYFQRVFERLLSRDDVATNPFVEHVLLGYYRRAPEWAGSAEVAPFELLKGGLLDVRDIGRFDVVHLSNIFDWSSTDEIAAWCGRLRRDAAAGTALILRQLNNQRDLQRDLGGAFELDETFSEALTAMSRTQFYERILVMRRRA